MTKILLTLISLLVATLTSVAPLAAESPLVQAPHIKTKNGASTNWSGYAVETNLNSPASGVVTDVKGQWVVPNVTCTSATTYSSIWVGIDGYSSSSVEQTGTEQDCRGGQPVYSAWYEMYPKFPKTLTMAIHPGDVMSGEVKYTGKSQFTLTLKNLTTGVSYSTVQKSNANRSSAEWVVEAPWSGGVLPLTNFGTAHMTGATATLGGHTGAINDPAWQNDPITMQNTDGTLKAVPTILSTDGLSFDVDWYNS